MAADKRSGHLRLKQALVLRDALAGELGLDLSKVMTQLYNVEDGIGAARALDEGRKRFTIFGIIPRHAKNFGLGKITVNPKSGCVKPSDAN